METTIRSRVGAQIIRPPASESDRRHPEHDYCPVLVTTNKTRAAIELQRLQAIGNNAANDADLPILVLAAMHISRKARYPLSDEEIDFLYGQTDNHFNKAAPYLALYQGAWMLISDNLNVKCGLGQGTRVRVIDWVFPDGTTFETVAFKNCRVRRPSAPPFLYSSSSLPRSSKLSPPVNHQTPTEP